MKILHSAAYYLQPVEGKTIMAQAAEITTMDLEKSKGEWESKKVSFTSDVKQYGDGTGKVTIQVAEFEKPKSAWRLDKFDAVIVLFMFLVWWADHETSWNFDGPSYIAGVLAGGTTVFYKTLKAIKSEKGERSDHR